MDKENSISTTLVASSVVYIQRQEMQNTRTNITSYNNDSSVYNGSYLLSSPSSPSPCSSMTSAGSSSAGSRNHSISTVLYFCVLGLMFLTPFFYYLRLHLEARQARRLSELAQNNRAQSQAKKLNSLEQRRARMLQMLAPVRMTLQRENFPKLLKEEGEDVSEPGVTSRPVRLTATENMRNGNSDDGGCSEDFPANEEEENQVVLIPVPGLFCSKATAVMKTSLDPVEATAIVSTANRPMRLAPSLCSICLSSFKIGSEILWSSNAACEHCFHSACMEHWLLQQKEGLLCPCCRRDFVVDPYDDNNYENVDIEIGLDNNHDQSEVVGNREGEAD